MVHIYPMFDTAKLTAITYRHQHITDMHSHVLLIAHNLNENLFRGESFRPEFARLGEVRSLIPESVRIMALTATVTLSTRAKIIKVLGMYKPAVVSVSPNQKTSNTRSV